MFDLFNIIAFCDSSIHQEPKLCQVPWTPAEQWKRSCRAWLTLSPEMRAQLLEFRRLGKNQAHVSKSRGE